MTGFRRKTLTFGTVLRAGWLVARGDIVEPMTGDVILKDPTQPILTILAAPAFSIYDRKLLSQHGGNAGPGAKDDDKATDWLNQNSAGSGPYLLKGWEQNQTIQLVRNPNYSNGKPGFDRVVIRHLS